MPPPQPLLCDLCGQKFFKRSLPIHRKQCEKKFAAAFSECKKCLRKVSNDEYEQHVSECKVVRTVRVAKPKVVKERPVKPAKKAKDCEGEDSSESESSSDEEDYREECGFCNRKFNPDRIAKHESVCATNSERKKRKRFKSSSEQRLKGTDFEKYIDPKARRQVDKPQSVWRNDHERLQGMVEQSRLVKAFKEAGVPLSELPRPGTDLTKLLSDGANGKAGAKPEEAPVPQGMKRCQHCTRTFSLEAAAKHIPKCKTTINKPKKLVRKSKPVLEKPKENHTEVIKSIIKRVLLMKNKKNDFFETKEASMFSDGEVVTTQDGRKGTVRYVGRVSQLFPGYWVGLELEEPKGNNDGSVEGSMYFKCPAQHGLFMRPSKIKKFIAIEAPPPKKEKTEEVTKSSSAKGEDIAPATPETDGIAPQGDSNTNRKANKAEDKAANPNRGMVQKLREEVRKNSPRNVKPAPAQKPNQEDAMPTQRKVTAAEKKANAAAAAKQKRLDKDVKLLEALHGTMSKGERGFGSREEVGFGKKLGSSAGTGQKLNAAAASKPGPTAKRPDRAARAAFFEKRFAQQQATTAKTEE
ncbi:150 kDa isoform (150 kDa dynein-associated polypeptide) (DAP-150) (DP-150) (p150-glued) [Durusdinium trenchii]|uniref:150 kDa isoform (150 kDa dynein-associated polypeptide) (DAP-150) (DP-150) (p150-glued) n=1 Tax=Durusdinium trenchii TaxID=1381693 RepID=A0ABP0SSW2_9DINO